MPTTFFTREGATPGPSLCFSWRTMSSHRPQSLWEVACLSPLRAEPRADAQVVGWKQTGFLPHSLLSSVLYLDLEITAGWLEMANDMGWIEMCALRDKALITPVSGLSEFCAVSRVRV
ncbi:unnamed protein product [Symbiodinium sp. CCMP2592]|nr:unnamed protein product [Symbiodinium sp. CCMP2592]